MIASKGKIHTFLFYWTAIFAAYEFCMSHWILFALQLAVGLHTCVVGTNVPVNNPSVGDE